MGVAAKKEDRKIFALRILGLVLQILLSMSPTPLELVIFLHADSEIHVSY